MSRIAIECTHCGAKLNLADESKLGKKIKCPKCSETFVASSEDDEDLDDMDDMDEDDDDEDEDERPRGKKGAAASTGTKKGAPAKGGGGKKGKGKSGGNTGLIIGGAVGAVVLLLGLVGGLFAAGVFSGAKPDPNQITVGPGGNGVFAGLLKEQGPTPIPPRGPVPEAAKWLPAETELVIHIRVADLLKSPLISELIKTNLLEDQVKAGFAAVGLTPDDLESVTVGVGGLDKAAQQMQRTQAAMIMGGMPPMTMDVPSVAVFQLKTPLTYDAITKAAQGQTVTKAQHAGKEFLEASAPNVPTKAGIYLAADKILLMGDSPHIKTAIEKGPNAKPVVNFGFMDWTDHLTLALAPLKPATLKQQMTAGAQSNPMAAIALAPIADGATGFSFGLTVKGGVEAEIAVGCLDSAKTEAITKSLNDLLGLGRGQYEQSKPQLPPWTVELTDQLVGGLKVSGSNRVVLMTTAIPDSAKEQLVQLPAMIMTQFMMNAMLGGPGGAMPPDKPATFSSPGNLSDEESSVEGEFTSNVTTPLPDWSGIKLLAFLGSNSSATPKDREQGTPLRVELNIRWNGADEDNVLVAAGRLKFDEGTSEAGSTFTPLANRAFGSIDSLYRMPLGKRYKSGFIELGRGEFTLPKVDTGPVTSLNGSFAAIKGTLIKKVVITKIRDAIGKPSEDPELVAAGFEITKPEEDIEIARVKVKPGFLLSPMACLDGKGQQFDGASGAIIEDLQFQYLFVRDKQDLKRTDLVFEGYLYGDLEEVTVPFEIKNIALPETVTK